VDSSGAMGRPLSASALGFVLLGLAFGCGDDVDSDFGPDYRRVQRQVEAFGNEVARTFELAGPSGDALVAPRFERLADRATSLDRRLAELRPPDSARSELAELRASLGRLRRDLRGVLSALREYNPGRWVSSRASAATHLRALRRVAAGTAEP
jgi:hypothetical protein